LLQETSSDLIARVKAILEMKDLRMLADKCKDLKSLTHINLKVIEQDRTSIEKEQKHINQL